MAYAAARATACGLLGVLFFLWSAEGVADALLASEIRAQPLASALAEFAHQTGLQLVYVSDVLKDQKSKGARAGVSNTGALTQLLDGTGLTFEFLNKRAVRIFVESPRSDRPDGPKPPPVRPVTARVLDEIDVTGSRDERVRAFEYLQNVPSSVSLVSGASLEAQKSEQLLDYAASVPGMNIATPGFPAQVETIIRGIYPATGAQSVAFYLDDIAVGPSGPYMAGQGLSLDLMPFDLERLEVWRDPQGTSVGAESEIGLVRYVLIQPDVADFHADVAADVFTIHGADNPGDSIFVAVNLPIVSGQLAVRVSGYDNYIPGYVDNLYNGAEGINVLRRYGGRIAALWRPTEAFVVTVDSLRKTDSAKSQSQVTSNQVAVVPNTGDAYFVRQTGSWGDLVDNVALLGHGSTRLDLLSVSLRWTPAALEVRSATAWSHIDFHTEDDQTQAYGAYYPAWSNGQVAAGLALYSQVASMSKFSEELHISSSSGRLVEWMLGGFYTSENASNYQPTQAFDKEYQPIEFFSPSLSFSNQPSTFTEQVLFGNTTWHVTGRLDLGAGVRLAHDEQSLNYASGAWNSPTSTFFARSDETDTSWMGSAKYRLNPSTVAYGRIASGFQPAFPNGPSPPVTMRGEIPVVYELGLKAKALDSRLLTDLVGFYVDWKDIQVGAFTPDDAYYVANGAHGFSKGFELTGSYAPIPDLRIGYAAAYTECALDSVIPAANYYLTGYQLPYVPKWTLSATAAYSWGLAGLWRAQLGGAVHWLDQQITGLGVQSLSLGGYPTVVIPSYWSIDMNAQAFKGPLTLRVFVRNLTDERAFVNSFAVPDFSGVPNQIVDKLLQPRTVGMGVVYSF